MRAQISSFRFESFGHFLQAVAYNSEYPNRERLARVNPALRHSGAMLAAASGGSEGLPSDGGYEVPPDYAGLLVKMAYDQSILASRVRKIPVTGNRLTINAIDEVSRVTGSRWGGVQVYRAAEADTVTSKKPKFRQINLVLKKQFGLAYATDELLEDVSAKEAIYQQAFTEEIAWMIDDEIFNGDGAGQMLGILNCGAKIKVAIETNQVTKTLVPENLVKMYTRMPQRLRQNAIWVANQDIEPTLYLQAFQVAFGGVPIFMPPGGMESKPYNRILGRDLVFFEQAKSVGTEGDIAFLNLGEYLMIEKDANEWASSVHVRFIYDEMTFRITARNDGQPAWHSAVTPANGTNTQSPFITLANR